MDTPKISVIVPVYNVEQCLPRCIDSILDQTFTDFELLLIDDGSPDNSGKICDEYAEKDSRIRVFHKKNGGVSSARNLGLDNVQGEWVAFIDSDDWVSSLYLQDLYSLTKNKKNGIILQGHLKVVEDKKIPQTQTERLYLQNEFYKMFKKHHLCRMGMPWSKLYDFSLIKYHELKFEVNIHYGEDLIFFLNYIYYADWVHFGNKMDYYYSYNNPTSLIRSYHSFDSEWTGYKSFKNIVDCLQKKYEISEKDIEFTKRWVLYFALRSVKTIYRYGKNRLKYKERIHLLKNKIAHEDRVFLNTYLKECNLFDKTICLLLANRKYVIVDCILNIFFNLRYSKFIKRIIK